MPRSVPILLLVLSLAPAVNAQSEGPAPDPELAKAAGSILRRNCYRCHKGQGSESGYAFDVTNVESLVDEGTLSAGDFEGSDIFDAMFSGRMPPRNRPQLPRPSAQDVETIKEWIQQGAAPLPKPEPRRTVTLKQELTAIRAHLAQQGRENRFNLRFFTIAHLHNDVTVDDELLITQRLALTKVLNSLSWEPLAVQVKAVDEYETVWAVDISKLGWTREHWNALAKAYPYALTFGSKDDPQLSELEADIQDLRGSDRTPVSLRADWVVAVATKPPLYYQLMYDLQLPQLRGRRADPSNGANPKRMTDLDLERYLGVDVAANIAAGKVWRSAFTESGVSGQNRMIERHALKSGGYYWKSYDFKSSNRTAILSEFPLGPNFAGNPFADLAFDHDGGEIIFNLPNGMQAYLLIDAEGSRIDAGPIEVVADSLRTSGNEQIVAGVSCIACHRHGMIEAPDDEVRPFSGAVGKAREQVRRLYPEGAEFRSLLNADRNQFLRALRSQLGHLTPDVPIDERPEPVGEAARQYHLEPMRLETVAAELYVSADHFRAALKTDPRLRRLGLRVLLRDGGTIKRAAWESPAAFPLMKQAARQFGYDPR